MNKPLAPLLAVLMLSLPLSACSDSANDGDGGVTHDSRPPVDSQAAQDSGPPPDAAVYCDLGDLFDQFQCGAGRKCTLTDGTTTLGCAAAGFSPAYGGCDGTFPDTCEIGSLCSNRVGAYRCLPFCSQPGSFCEGGRCGQNPVISQGGESAYLCEPADNCNPVTADPASSGCDTGEACYIASVGAGLTFCEPEGLQGQGESCVEDFDCLQGYSCFGPSTGPRECRKVCRADTDADCPSGQFCGPLNETFGICF